MTAILSAFAWARTIAGAARMAVAAAAPPKRRRRLTPSRLFEIIGTPPFQSGRMVEGFTGMAQAAARAPREPGARPCPTRVGSMAVEAYERDSAACGQRKSAIAARASGLITRIEAARNSIKRSRRNCFSVRLT